ncbi:MAG: hypothetical protein DMG68_11965 [Acidobacteria bacterium]|jgi:tetratricopeptide (TPR) repeat protein|nr:MAG: hypothetical protein DMG68_11965 [Acidobacteriota bacterium]
MHKLRFALLFLLCVLNFRLLADEGHQHAPHAGEVGSVNFPVSCSAAAQKIFSRSVAMLHSFWYEEAAKSFTAAAEQDPSCAMAWWGVAMSYYHPLWEPPTADAMKPGAAAVQKAKALNAHTDRERGYIAAIDAFYSADATQDYLARNRIYSQAMEKVYRANPGDTEAAIFYALSLKASSPPSDKTFANERQGGAILEKIFAQQPNHPGIAHYIIHCYDNPALANQGLDAARRYAQIAPDVPHALHMPSHIFVRLGLWDEAAKSNFAAMNAGKKYEQDTSMNAAWDQRLHPTDYLVYALLQSGNDAQAAAIAKEVDEIQKSQPGNLTGGYVLAAVPARYALERRAWADAAALKPRPSAFHYTEAVTYWARAIGEAHTGDLSGAKKDIGQLKIIENQLLEARQDYWASQTQVLLQSASGWLAHAQAKSDEDEERAVMLLNGAADLEDSMEKHPITPGAVLPAREQLADLLLELKRPAEALAVYEVSMKTAPNRFNSLFGAAKAAEAAGNTPQARHYYAKLVENCAGSQTHRAEFAQASGYLAKE